jgi:UDP-glucose 4-epimerase
MTASRYFITGGAGFIGSHLAEYAVAHDHPVTIYDNLSSGSRRWLSAIERRPGVTVIEGDVRNADRLTEAMGGHDIVWHLAANGDIPGGLQNVRMDLENNTLGTFNVLNAMRDTGLRALVFTSSSTIYGEVKQFPTPEDAGPVLPISLYGASKLAGEALISAFCHLFEMRAWIFRFGNVLGARMGHGIIYDFIHKLKRNPRELEILGDGEQQKNYFLVEECIEGMHWAVERSSAQFDVFNLGRADTITAKEIAAIVVEEMGLRDVRLSFAGGRRGWPGDVPQVIYDVGKMRRLGWEARHSSAEAVRVAARRLIAQFGAAQPAPLAAGGGAV